MGSISRFRSSEPEIIFSNDLPTIFLLCMKAFMHKRKMVGKSFEKIISGSELLNLDIDPKSRPENISVEEYVKIAETLL